MLRNDLRKPAEAVPERDLDAADADRADALAAVVAHRRADTEDAGAVLLVVDCEAALADARKLAQERVDVRDRVRRPRRQTGAERDRADGVVGELRQDRLAEGAAVRELAPAEVALDPDGAGSVDAPDHDRVAVVEDADARGAARRVRQPPEHGHRDVVEGDLREREVAEPGEREAEPVPPAVHLRDEVPFGERPDERERAALRRAERPRELGEPDPAGAGGPDRVERGQGAVDALDAVAARAVALVVRPHRQTLGRGPRRTSRRLLCLDSAELTRNNAAVVDARPSFARAERLAARDAFRLSRVPARGGAATER